MINQKKSHLQKCKFISFLSFLLLFIVSTTSSYSQSDLENINLLVRSNSSDSKFTHVLPIPDQELVATVSREDLKFNSENYIDAKIKISPIRKVFKNKVLLRPEVKEIKITIPNYVKMGMAKDYRLPIMKLSPLQKWLMVFQENEIQFWNTKTQKLHFKTTTISTLSNQEENIETFTKAGKDLWYNKHFAFSFYEDVVAFYEDHGHIAIYNLRKKRKIAFFNKKYISGANFTPFIDLDKSGNVLMVFEESSSSTHSYISFFDVNRPKKIAFKKVRLLADKEDFWKERLRVVGYTMLDNSIYLIGIDKSLNVLSKFVISVDNASSNIIKDLSYNDAESIVKDENLILYTYRNAYRNFYLGTYKSNDSSTSCTLERYNVRGKSQSFYVDTAEAPLFNPDTFTFFVDSTYGDFYYTDYNDIYMVDF